MIKEFNDLKGKTLVSVSAKIGDEEMTFETTEEEKFMLYYEHD